MKELAVLIVSYQRKEYTIGTIKNAYRVLPSNSQIFVIDNGSNDGTRNWLQENQEKYNLGLIFPEENLRVGGAWTLFTNYYQPNDFNYILLLDNDLWMIPNQNWFEYCMSVFNSDPKIGSLGLFNERNPGLYAKEQIKDHNYDRRVPFKDREIYNTIYYAGGRLDKFNLWHQTMNKWPHKYIGDKIGRNYNSKGFKTIKITPGFLTDISIYNFDNPKHEEYNRWFYSKERDPNEYKRVSSLVYDQENLKKFVIDTYGEEYLKYIL